MVICERVALDYGYDEENAYLVQYDDTPEEQKKRLEVIDRLKAAGHTVDCSSTPTVRPGDEPAVSWADLADIMDV